MANPPTTSVPATIAVIAVLMDDADTPTGYMEAGHQALNSFVQNQINNFIYGINLLNLNAAVQKLVSPPKGSHQQPLSYEAATVLTIQNQLAPVIASIQSGATAVVSNAVETALIQGRAIGALGTFVDPDTPIGTQYLTIVQDQLMNLNPLGETNYTPYEINLNNPTSNDTYYVFGFAQNLNRIVSIPPGVQPGNWQVTGVNKGFSNSLRSSYIKEIGGQNPDGSQWYIERAKAVGLIQSGINSFYVVGADGSGANVIVSDKPIDGETGLDYYLTTTPDRSLEDNLDSLQPFSLTRFVAGAPTP